jgi:hypothetical protein
MAPERIPAEYNSGNNTIEVSTDGENHFEFDIKSRRVGLKRQMHGEEVT